MKKNTLASYMIGIQSYNLSKEEIDYLNNPFCAGVILFTRNYKSKKQLSYLIEEIRAISDDIIIGVDHEGGRVQRFKEGFTIIPPMKSLGDLYDSGLPLDKTKRLSHMLGGVLSYELACLDIDFSFTPVLDIGNPISSIIGNRAFHKKAEIIESLSSSFYKGLKEMGMAGVSKHFPGHGNVSEDSHLTLPIDERSFKDIFENDIRPFKTLIDQGIEAVMPAHVLYSMVDGMPAGFSEFWLSNILKDKLGFSKMIISDDLDMLGAAAIGTITERIELASHNCDLILLCNNSKHIKEAFSYTKKRVIKEDFSFKKSLLKRKKERLNKDKYLAFKEELICSQLINS